MHQHQDKRSCRNPTGGLPPPPPPPPPPHEGAPWDTMHLTWLIQQPTIKRSALHHLVAPPTRMRWLVCLSFLWLQDHVHLLLLPPSLAPKARALTFDLCHYSEQNISLCAFFSEYTHFVCSLPASDSKTLQKVIQVESELC